MNSLKVIWDKDTWQEIFGSIAKNKTRTIITVIGVLWGIFIYIALSGAAKGLDNGFERQFENIAKNSMFVWAQNTSIPYDGFKIGRKIVLKVSDIEYLKRQVPQIEYVAARNAIGVFGGTSPLVVRKNKSSNYNVYGDYPDYIKIATKKLYDGGRFINDNDITHARKVCVIGERTLEELYERGENPVGTYIRIKDIYFQVIGVHKFIQGGGFDSDGDIYIPFTTFKKNI